MGSTIAYSSLEVQDVIPWPTVMRLCPKKVLMNYKYHEFVTENNLLKDIRTVLFPTPVGPITLELKVSNDGIENQ
jgi:hypothetical protein